MYDKSIRPPPVRNQSEVTPGLRGCRVGKQRGWAMPSGNGGGKVSWALLEENEVDLEKSMCGSFYLSYEIHIDFCSLFDFILIQHWLAWEGANCQQRDLSRARTANR